MSVGGSTADRRRVVAALALPRPLLVDEDVLGMRARTRIGEHDAYLYFPEKGGDAYLERHRLCPAEVSGVVTADGAQWGFGSQGTGFVVSAVAVAFVGTPSGEGDPAPVAEFSELAQAVHDWFEDLNAWVVAWLRLPDQPPEQEVRPNTLIAPRPGATPVLSGSSTSLPMITWRSVGRDRLVKGLALAGKGSRPPVEYEVMTSAMSAAMRGRFRPCVIDACTAAEVAMSSAIRRALPRIDPAFVEQAIVTANGAAGLYGLAASLGLPVDCVSKGKLINQLLEVRNRAGHAANVPSVKETGQAINVAWTLLEALSPLPQP